MDFSELVVHHQSLVRKDVSKQDISEYWEICREKGHYPYRAMDRQPWFDEIERPVTSKGVVVQLSAFEIALALKLGPERTKAARKAGAWNMIQDGKPGSDRERFIEQNGIAGEIAFAKLFNIFPSGQLLIEARKAKDDDGDHVLEDRVIDVKTTEYPYGKLTLAPWKANEDFFDRVHVLSLMTGDIRSAEERRSGNGKRGSYVWHGFISSRDIVNPTRLKPLPGRDKPEYIASQAELSDCLGDWPSPAARIEAVGVVTEIA